MTARISEHQRENRAIVLLREGFRTSIVGLVTGLNPRTLRLLFKEIYGRSPAQGQLPTSEAILATRQRLLDGGLLLQLYTQLSNGVAFSQIKMEALIRAFHLYQDMRLELGFAGDPLNINESWVIARDLRSKRIEMLRCKTCGGIYIQMLFQQIEHGCHFCGDKAHVPLSSNESSTSEFSGRPNKNVSSDPVCLPEAVAKSPKPRNRKSAAATSNPS